MKPPLALVALAALAVSAPSVRAQGGPNQPDMRTIHALFADSQKIARGVKEIPGGIASWTDSKDPKVARLIQEHVAAMKARLERGQPIRMWDPLFKVLFDHADKVTMRIENTKTGVRIVETSDDPYVVKLIREHAKAVSGFVHEGMAGMHREHPAPAKGAAPAPKQPAFRGKGDGVSTCPVTGEPVDPAVTTPWKGRKVAFCCPSCAGAFRAAPERFLRVK